MGAAVKWAMAVFLASLTAGCGETTTSDHQVLTESEVSQLEIDATSGDVGSMKRLASHFGALSQTDRERYWNRLAREAGDPEELYFEAARLEARARSMSNANARHQVLVDALDNVERAKSAKAKRPSEESLSELETSIRAGLNETAAE